MIKPRIIIFLICSLLPLSGAVAESTGNPDRMRVLLEKCGILDRLREFPRQVFEAMGHTNNTAQSKRYTPERDAFFQAFNVEEMEQDLVVQMMEQMNELHFGKALDWYQSPLGKQVTALERTTYSDHAWQGRQTFFQGLERTASRQDRIDKIQQLMESSYLSKIDEELEMTTALALTGAMNSTLPAEEQIDLDHIRQALQVQREDRKQAIQEEQSMNFMYLYHRLPDQEVERYIDFLHSASGRNFNSAMLISLNRVFQSASEKIGTALGRAVKGERRI